MRTTSLVLLIIAVIVLLLVGFYLTNPSRAQQLLVELGVGGAGSAGYSASGILEAPSFQVSSPAGGRVLEILVEEGVSVERGQELARLDAADLQLQLEAALQRHQSASARLQLLESAPRQVDLDAAQAAIDYALAVLDAATQAVIDAQRSGTASTRSERVAIATAEEAAARSAFDAANSRFQQLETGAGEADRTAAAAAVEAAGRQISRLQALIAGQTLRSPIDGVLRTHLIEAWDLAQPGWPVLVVADLSELELTIYLPEADLNRVQIADQVRVTVDPFPEERFAGVVSYIADHAEYTPRNVQTPGERSVLVYAVKIRVPNRDGRLIPGLPAEVQLEVSE